MAGLTKNSAVKKPASQKQTEVASFERTVKASTVMVLVECTGLSVAHLSKVRKELRKDNATLSIIKNTLAKRALSNQDAPSTLLNAFKGPVAVLLGNDDQVAPVKAYAKAMKELKKEAIFQGGLLDGAVLSASDVEGLVNMPPLLELRGKLLGGIASPVTGLVAAISGPQRALVNVLDQFAKQQAAG
jgi:large subunit ribosomal protein L10